MKLPKKPLHWMLTLFAVVALAVGAWGAANADAPAPVIPPYPPLPPVQAPSSDGAVSTPTHISGLPPLKAVLLVGPIDGDDGPWTTREKANMDLAASELEAHGVTVHRFYTPANDWAEITAAATGAHFFLYRGHGIYWNSVPSPEVGGFALKGRLISSDDIRTELRLAPNAVVMLYGCYTAGSAGAEEGSIGSDAAQVRVAQYSDPFFDIGAAGYYANWYGDAFQVFLRELFEGKTLGQAYESFYDFDGDTVERYARPMPPGFVVWLDKDYWWESWQYNNAFAGLADQTLGALFQPQDPEMRVAPSQIIDLAEPGSGPQHIALRVSVTPSDAFPWIASISPDVPWLDLQPQSGESDEMISVVIRPTDLSLGTYRADIRVVAYRAGLEVKERKVPVVLHVEERVYSAYLPLTLTASP